MSINRLGEHLDDWVAAGLIARDQADAITAHEATRGTSSLPRWVEPVAYLGAALVVVALVTFGAEVWDQIAPWGRALLFGLIAASLVVVGVALHRSGAEPAKRGGQVAWLFAVGAVAATVAVVLSEFTDLSNRYVSLWSAVGAFATALPLWVAARSSLQQVALAVSAVFTVLSSLESLRLAPDWLPAALLAAIGFVWLLLTWGGIMTPAGAGWVIGSILTAMVGIGGFSFGTGGWWFAAGIVVGLALVWLSTRLDRRAMLAIGVVALLVWIPAFVSDIFAGTIAVPIAILVTGVVTLSVVVAAVRGGRGARSATGTSPTPGPEAGDDDG